MPLALELEHQAQLRYDGEIPPEVLAAIAAAEQAEREAALTTRLSPRPSSASSPPRNFVSPRTASAPWLD